MRNANRSVVNRPLVNCYGTTNRAEFFAVATETFFCRPAALSSRHAELYDGLRGYYRTDSRGHIEESSKLR